MYTVTVYTKNYLKKREKNQNMVDNLKDFTWL